MPGEPGSGEKQPPSLADVLRWGEQNAARKHRRDNPRQGTEIHEHLDLDQADASDRQRRREHPTTGSTQSIPDRWTSTGKKPEQPGR